MKVLKDLKINNESKKINASEIAVVEDNNKYKTLDSKLSAMENNIMSLRLKKIWENTNTTSAFGAQDIILSSNDYDFYIVVTLNANTTIGTDLQNFVTSCFSQKGKGVQFLSWYNNAINTRSITYVNETTLHANNNNRQTPGGSISQNNNYLIPYQIYGCKF